MANHLHQNVKQVLDAMKLQDDFWFNYPIFLPDYEQFNNADNDIISAVGSEDVNRAYQQINLPN
jgi:ATP sulfurylase